MIFPTLFKKVNNRVRQWKIIVTKQQNNSGIHYEIHTEYGFIDGKITKSKPHLIKSYENAKKKAETRWKNKKREGFYEKNKPNKTDFILPMKPSNINIFKIKLPACVQPKINGVRALYINNKLYSRTGRPYPHLEYILNQLKHINLKLDGELYSPIIPFSKLKGLLQKKEKSPDIRKIRFYVFDCINDQPFDKRYELLKELFKKNKFKGIYFHPCIKIYNYNQIDSLFEKSIKDGYEGIIIRNYMGKYLPGKVSPDLFKSKNSQIKQFKIVGFKPDIHGETVTWQLKCLKSNKTFYAPMTGSLKFRKNLLTKADQYIGKMAKVKYYDMDLKTGCVTRNPIVIKI